MQNHERTVGGNLERIQIIFLKTVVLLYEKTRSLNLQCDFLEGDDLFNSQPHSSIKYENN